VRFLVSNNKISHLRSIPFAEPLVPNGGSLDGSGETEKEQILLLEHLVVDQHILCLAIRLAQILARPSLFRCLLRICVDNVLYDLLPVLRAFKLGKDFILRKARARLEDSRLTDSLIVAAAFIAFTVGLSYTC
jgi:hypothetical protein